MNSPRLDVVRFRVAVALAVLAIASFFLSGCTGRARREAVANSAASIWEAADAIDRDPSPEIRSACVRIIKLQAAAMIRAMQFTYRPAGVTDGSDN